MPDRWCRARAPLRHLLASYPRVRVSRWSERVPSDIGRCGATLRSTHRQHRTPRAIRKQPTHICHVFPAGMIFETTRETNGRCPCTRTYVRDGSAEMFLEWESWSDETGGNGRAEL